MINGIRKIAILTSQGEEAFDILDTSNELALFIFPVATVEVVNLEEINSVWLPKSSRSEVVHVASSFIAGWLSFQQWDPGGSDLSLNDYCTRRVLGPFVALVMLLKILVLKFLDLLQVHAMITSLTRNDKMNSECQCPYPSLEDKDVFLAVGSDRTQQLGFIPTEGLSSKL